MPRLGERFRTRIRHGVSAGLGVGHRHSPGLGVGHRHSPGLGYGIEWELLSDRAMRRYGPLLRRRHGREVGNV